MCARTSRVSERPSRVVARERVSATGPIFFAAPSRSPPLARLPLPDSSGAPSATGLTGARGPDMATAMELDPYTFGAEQRCFGCGPHNDRGLRMRFRREGDEVVTEIVAREGWEGPPNVFHGGLQATVADELAGWTLVGLLGRMGFTTSMSVRYVRPLQIGVPIVGRGRLARRKDPIATVTVRLEQNGKLGCSARVSYMLPDAAKAASYLGGTLPEGWRPLFEDR